MPRKDREAYNRYMREYRKRRTQRFHELIEENKRLKQRVQELTEILLTYIKKNNCG